ncbi:hypothetical protein E2C01_036022 [Portunus trituberculatus]|uniref:Uncharacterized protein n=1 Tax=Portunus trituberculatus TaxID=210409 RepID=A0A5B7F7J7_PORTR|nr:hypothetical protein [Portunus trituberculatus]
MFTQEGIRKEKSRKEKSCGNEEEEEEEEEEMESDSSIDPVHQQMAVFVVWINMIPKCGRASDAARQARQTLPSGAPWMDAAISVNAPTTTTLLHPLLFLPLQYIDIDVLPLNRRKMSSWGNLVSSMVFEGAMSQIRDILESLEQWSQGIATARPSQVPL